jgi:N-acetylmuramoyl-L-alanine amidase
MKKILTLAVSVLIIFIVLFAIKVLLVSLRGSAPPYQVEDLNPPTNPYDWIEQWQRPNVPAKVALQAGHWKNSDLPEELERLIGRTGSSGGGKSEWEINLAIAEETAQILSKEGIEVEILPATIPPRYWADVFVAIHADGSLDISKRGFKTATPRRDFSKGAEKLVGFIEESYQDHTGFVKDPNVTRNMRGYYAFAWWRYEHAVHPRTASVILETGFLSNAADRKIISDNPDVAAQGIAEGIVSYLKSQNLI